ncbi:MAG: dihydroorotate dehydrogenase [Candidatus Omnitrophica bacterium]|nr:dihydroorotate dehydrogenase [Candidatus Omnitrophota bacterium]
MKIETKIAKFKLLTPIVCASGTVGFGQELIGLCDFSSIGAITTKTITLNSREGNPPPRIYESGEGVLNSVGLENPGLEGFIEEKLPKLKNLKTKCIVSVGGFSINEYKTIVKALGSKKDVHALEINLSCPNLQLKKLISQDEKATYQITKSLRKLTKKPLIIKITPEVTDIVKIAKMVEKAGADAIAMVNTFFSMAINIETQKPFLGNGYGGYSGRAIKPMSLYRVWRVAQNVKIPIIGGGGIETASDAIEFILAGATAVSLGTINLVNPNSAQSVLKGIKNYMKRKKITGIEAIRGAI